MTSLTSHLCLDATNTVFQGCPQLKLQVWHLIAIL